MNSRTCSTLCAQILKRKVQINKRNKIDEKKDAMRIETDICKARENNVNRNVKDDTEKANEVNEGDEDETDKKTKKKKKKKKT